jgi:uncharacterized SAM-binding protein YcdF (DUF218 family)
MTHAPRGRIRQLVAGTVLAAAALWTASVLAVVVAGARDDRPPSDAIVVLGAAQYAGRPSPVLRARLDHAAMLFQDGVAPLVLLTGGRGEGDTTSEAAVGRRYLLARGVPDSALLLEPEGRTTAASLTAAAQLLQARGAQRVVLVSDPFHALRVRVVAWRLGLTAVASPTRTSPILARSWREWRYIAGEGVKVPVAVLAPRR